MSEKNDYPLGYSAEEEQRLAQQGALVAETTSDLLRRAGIARGMRVLDIGCGVGDVSLLVARMVGEQGAVLGVDRAAGSIETARRRAEEAGAANVVFEVSELAAFETQQKFDAIVGRFVLAYVPDRADVLRRLARALRPGGVVALQEIDMEQIAQIPASELFTQVRDWVLRGFAAGGAELAMGTKLYATFLDADLPTPDMIAATPVVGGPECGAYEQFPMALKSLAPMLERDGVADVSAIGVDTLAQRLRDDAAANGRVVFMSRIVSAWTRVV